MNGRGIVLALLIISVLALCIVCTDDSDGMVTETFTVNDVVYEVLNDNDVRAIRVESTTDPNVVIPPQVTDSGHSYIVSSIGEEFIEYANVESLHLPATIVEIQSGAFKSYPLGVITVDPANTTFYVKDNVLYDAVRKSLVRYCPNNPNTLFEIPSGILFLDAFSFHNAKNLEEIRGLPRTLKMIEESTFNGCDMLSRISYDLTKGVNVLPESLTYIGKYAFSMCNFEHISLPKSLIMLDQFAFSYNDLLRTIDIPSEVSNIGTSAFYACKSLESISVSQYNPYYASLDGVLFMKKGIPATEWTLIHYPSMRPGTFYEIPELSNDIEPDAFYGADNLKTVVLNDNFFSVPDSAFSGAHSLVKVVIPSTVYIIESRAFTDCISLTTIEGGESVVLIEYWAFERTNLSHPFIARSVVVIAQYAFYACMGFVDIRIPSNVKSLSSLVFENCSNIRTITFEGTDIELEPDSLSIGTVEYPVSVTVYHNKGLSIPSDTYNEFTKLDIVEFGEKPYPWMNLIGVAVCLLILFGMFRLFREV